MIKLLVFLLAAATVMIAGGLLLTDFSEKPERIIRGTASVQDGDTLEVTTLDGGDRYTIRIDALHAPEPDEEGGIAARDWMRNRLKGRQVECRLKARPDRFGRAIGRCSVDGKDVGAELVAAGLARACVRYGIHYLEFETPRSKTLKAPEYCIPD